MGLLCEGDGRVTDPPLPVALFVLRTFPPRAGETRPASPPLGSGFRGDDGGCAQFSLKGEMRG